MLVFMLWNVCGLIINFPTVYKCSCCWLNMKMFNTYCYIVCLSFTALENWKCQNQAIDVWSSIRWRSVCLWFSAFPLSKPTVHSIFFLSFPLFAHRLHLFRINFFLISFVWNINVTCLSNSVDIQFLYFHVCWSVCVHTYSVMLGCINTYRSIRRVQQKSYAALYLCTQGAHRGS